MKRPDSENTFHTFSSVLAIEKAEKTLARETVGAQWQYAGKMIGSCCLASSPGALGAQRRISLEFTQEFLSSKNG